MKTPYSKLLIQPQIGVTADLTGKAITFGGSAAFSASKKIMGRPALYLPTGSYIQMPDSADWDLGTNPFYLSLWINFITIDPAGYTPIIQEGAGVSAGTSVPFYTGWGLSVRANTLEMIRYTPAQSQKAVSWTPTAGVDYFLVIARNGNELKIYVDGSQVGATQDVTGVFYNRGGAGVGVISGYSRNGDNGVTWNRLNAYLSEIHLIAGVLPTQHVQQYPYGRNIQRIGG